MKLMFVDETEQCGCFGVSLVCIDSTKYSVIAKNILNALNEKSWSLDKEFKSTCIFSSSNGDLNIEIEARKEIAEKIIQTNVSESNARVKCYFAFLRGAKNPANYKKLLEKIFSKITRANTANQGKNLIGLYFDELSYSGRDREVIISSTTKLLDKGYFIIEHPSEIKSSNITPGVLFADHIAFISLWNKLNSTERNQEVPEIKQKKNEYISDLVNQLRHITFMEVRT